MREFMLVTIAACLVGCGDKQRRTADDDNPSSTRLTATATSSTKPSKQAETTTTPPSPPVVSFTTTYLKIQQAYFDNEFEADAAYRNKVGIVDIFEIVNTGRDDNGNPIIATHSFGHNPAPNGFFHFAAGQEAELAKLKRGGAVRVEGKCLGKKSDGIDRAIRGYDFRIDFVDCRVVGPVPTAKK